MEVQRNDLIQWLEETVRPEKFLLWELPIM